MDPEIRWSPEAIDDLEAIAEYIARDSAYYARAVVRQMLSASRRVAEFPLIGRIVPEIGNENIRERFIYSYRLIYRIESRIILVVAVIHGKRLLENTAERFEENT